MGNSKVPERVTGPWGSVPGSVTAECTVIDTKQQSEDILCLQNILQTKIISQGNYSSDKKRAKQCFSTQFEFFYTISFFIICMHVGGELDNL